MSYDEIKHSVNSDLTGDPVNCLVYINSIESEREKSYILDKRNASMFRDLITNSVTVFKIPGIHKLIYDRLSSADIDYMVEGNARLATCLNNFYEEDIFTTGNIDSILTQLSDEKMDKLDKKIRDGITRYITKRLEPSTNTYGSGTYLSKLFDIPELNNLPTKEFFFNDNAKEKIYQNTALMELLSYSTVALLPFTLDNTKSHTNMADLLSRDDVVAYIETSDRWLNCICNDMVGLGKFIAKKAELNPDDFEDYNAILDKSSAINKVIADESLMKYVYMSTDGTIKTCLWRISKDFTNSPDIKKLLTDEETYNAIVASKGTSTDAMAILSHSSVVVSQITGNHALMKSLLEDAAINSDTALGVATNSTGCLYDTSLLPDGAGDLYAKIFNVEANAAAVFNDYTACENIFNDGTCLNKVCTSETASAALSNSATALHALADNEGSLKMVADSDIPAAKLISTDTSFTFITSRIRLASFVAYSLPMLTSLISNGEKLTSILEKPAWREIFMNSWMAVDKIMNSTTALNLLSASTPENKTFVDDLLESDTLSKHMLNVTALYDTPATLETINQNNILKKVLDSSTKVLLAEFQSVIKEITSFVAAEKSHYEDVANRVTTGDQSLSGTLQTIANSVQANGDATRAIVQGGSVPVVKRVEIRCLGNIQSSNILTTTYTYMNPNKTIFLISSGYSMDPYIMSFDGVTLTVHIESKSYGYSIGIQAIEFY